VFGPGSRRRCCFRHCLPPGTYFSNPATWLSLARGLAFNPQLGLPGVFESNPFPDAVNGSLWTLRIECLCYVGLLAAARLRLLEPWNVTVLAVLGLGVVALTQGAVDPAAVGVPPVAAALMRDPRVVAILACCVHFLMGASIWVWRDSLPCSAALGLVGVLALAMLAGTRLTPVAFHIVFPYLILWAGLGPTQALRTIRRTEGRTMGRLGDISYGTYLYAFPIQQAIVARLGPLDPLALAALAAGPVLALAALSRRTVEIPALRLKRAARTGRPEPTLRSSERL
jgi:peptidoglycan/LPS O-acetylase OafA/YrhL